MQLVKNNDRQLAGGLPYLTDIRKRTKARRKSETKRRIHAWSFARDIGTAPSWRRSSAGPSVPRSV